MSEHKNKIWQLNGINKMEFYFQLIIIAVITFTIYSVGTIILTIQFFNNFNLEYSSYFISVVMIPIILLGLAIMSQMLSKFSYTCNFELFEDHLYITFLSTSGEGHGGREIRFKDIESFISRYDRIGYYFKIKFLKPGIPTYHLIVSDPLLGFSNKNSKAFHDFADAFEKNISIYKKSHLEEPPLKEAWFY
jgi:hypothetical protein